MKIYTVDAFTNEAFYGNPAGVCLLEGTEQKSEAWMQQTAAEMNLSETAFLFKKEEGEYGIRWFTPSAEVDLCGHATLASAHVLWEEKEVAKTQTITFQSASGPLAAFLKEGSIWLDFPSEPPEPAPLNEGLLQALGIKAPAVEQNRMDVVVEVDSEAALRNIVPDMEALAEHTTRGCIVTSLSEEEGIDFVSRCFFPAIGVEEDPVTGSAHCALGPYWAKRMAKQSFTAKQASKREGIVEVEMHRSRCHIGGRAVTVMKGDWLA
ncbi:PhzF family phenazine biosynthesis protein [Marinococcus sp. PL1-022]|uniref:PhzF family phenazine biosynthesis protein n=1 Tax=Marinococcus sp. PL1-022 TaxID=3095363 RepID=UPI0029C152D7|nr:PhzF family phenazine biosynthesis protein [Marinococcus sp. PL1-022]MDX6153890.1 PhzF family phenazine biosynthesis protein [Marinococcus sp. PL1-022]